MDLDPGRNSPGAVQTATPTMKRLLASVAVAAILAPSLPAQQGQTPGWAPPPLPVFRPGFDEVRPHLEARIAEHRGVVGVVLLDPVSAEVLSIRGEEPFPSASMVKIPILYEVMLRVEEGDLTLEDPLVMLAGDRVPGSGILQHLSAPFQLSVRDAAFLMMALSDNTATNLILGKVGPRDITDRMAALGLSETRVFRRVFRSPEESWDLEGSQRWGFGVTAPMELAMLLAWIHRGEAVSEEASREMLRMLEAQEHRVGIPRLLPSGTRVAHKTGSISAARHDCGIVFGPAREYVLCIMTRENEDRRYAWDNEAEILQADLSRLVFEALHPG